MFIALDLLLCQTWEQGGVFAFVAISVSGTVEGEESRVNGKILVRRSEFDTWIAAYRQTGWMDVDAIVGDVMRGLAQAA